MRKWTPWILMVLLLAMPVQAVTTRLNSGQIGVSAANGYVAVTDGTHTTWTDPATLPGGATLDDAYDNGNTIDYTGASSGADAVIFAVTTGDDPVNFWSASFDAGLIAFLTTAGTFQLEDGAANQQITLRGVDGFAGFNESKTATGDLIWSSQNVNSAFFADASLDQFFFNVSVANTEYGLTIQNHGANGGEFITMLTDDGDAMIRLKSNDNLGGRICINDETGTTVHELDATFFGINDIGGDIDTYIEGDTITDLFYVDASTDRVGIGDAVPDALFDVDGIAEFNQIDLVDNGGAGGHGNVTHRAQDIGAPVDYYWGPDGAAGTVMITDGSGNLSFTDQTHVSQFRGYRSGETPGTDSYINLDPAATTSFAGTDSDDSVGYGLPWNVSIVAISANYIFVDPTDVATLVIYPREDGTNIHADCKLTLAESATVESASATFTIGDYTVSANQTLGIYIDIVGDTPLEDATITDLHVTVYYHYSL